MATTMALLGHSHCRPPLRHGRLLGMNKMRQEIGFLCLARFGTPSDLYLGPSRVVGQDGSETGDLA